MKEKLSIKIQDELSSLGFDISKLKISSCNYMWGDLFEKISILDNSTEKHYIEVSMGLSNPYDIKNPHCAMQESTIYEIQAAYIWEDLINDRSKWLCSELYKKENGPIPSRKQIQVNLKKMLQAPDMIETLKFHKITSLYLDTDQPHKLNQLDYVKFIQLNSNRQNEHQPPNLSKRRR